MRSLVQTSFAVPGEAARPNFQSTRGCWNAMRRRRGPGSWLLLAAAFVLALARPASGAEGDRFDPASAFPSQWLAWLHVPSVSGLVRALEETTAGRLLGDPEVQAALGGLPRALREAVGGEPWGSDLLGLLRLLEGEVAVSVTGLDPVARLSVAAAVELGGRREEVLAALERLGRSLGGGGEPPPPLEVAGRRAVRWRLGGIPLHHLVLGSHLVLATSPEVLRGIIEAFERPPDPAGTAAESALAANPRFSEARRGLRLERPVLSLALNAEMLRGLVLPLLLLDRDTRPIFRAVQASGAAGISVLGLSLGTREGILETRALVGIAGGAGGLLGEVLASLEPPAETAGALALFPPGTFAAGALSIDLGRVLRAIDRFVREGLPLEVAHDLDGRLRSFLDRHGLSLKKDVFGLGRLDLVLGMVWPRAGCLFPDVFLVVPTAAPGRALLEKLGKMQAWARRAAWVDLPGNVTAVSPSTQALRRLAAARSTRAEWRPAGGGGVLADPSRLDPSLADAEAFLSVQGPGGLLRAYNTLVALAPIIQAARERDLRPQGVDLTLLPPGEKLLRAAPPGFLRLDVSPTALELHVRGEEAHFLLLGSLAALLVFGPWSEDI